METIILVMGMTIGCLLFGTRFGRRGLRASGKFLWRYITGKPLDGVPRTDATFRRRGTRTLTPEEQFALRPPEGLIAEIRQDVVAIREEFRRRRQ